MRYGATVGNSASDEHRARQPRQQRREVKKKGDDRMLLSILSLADTACNGNVTPPYDTSRFLSMIARLRGEDRGWVGGKGGSPHHE